MARTMEWSSAFLICFFFIKGVTGSLRTVARDAALRNQFVQAMEEAEERHRHAALEEKHFLSLQQKLMETSQRIITLQKPKKTLEVKGRSSFQKHVVERRLDNWYDNYYYDQQRQNQYNYEQNQYSGSSGNLDLSSYALKYVGCQNIHQWSDYRVQYADQNGNAYGSPLEMNRFVMLRLCERNSCSNYNKWGCNNNYGEYVIPMEDYLEIMAAYHFVQYETYCGLCESCMTMDNSAYFSDDGAAANDDASSYYNDGYQNRRELNNNWNNYYQQNNNYNNGNAYQQNNYNQNNYQNSGLPYYADPDTGECLYSSSCSNYKSACSTYTANATYFEDYFRCTSFSVGGGVGYL